MRDAASYLAALIDGEGSISADPNNRCVTIVNTDRSIISTALECLATLGVTARRSEVRRNARRKPIITLKISGRTNLLKLRKIPLGSAQKRERLTALLAYKQVHRTDPPLDEVRSLAAMGLTGTEIGTRLGVCETTAYRWMARAQVKGPGRWPRSR